MTDTTTGIATGRGPVPSAARPGLLGRLMAAVRPEFRADELVFDPANPVFGGDLCRVNGCGRTARGRGLCQGHRNRWVGDGRPDQDEFVATTDPRWRKHTPLMSCQAPGCRYGVTRRKGLCARHAGAWERAGQPDLRGWLDHLPTMTPAGPPPVCLIGTCQLWSEPSTVLCRSHHTTWKARGRPDIAAFTASWAEDDPVPAHERIYLDALSGQVKLEIQYALQRRHDERATKTPPFLVMIVVRFVADSGVISLLDWTEETWRQRFGKTRRNACALLIYARRQVEDLAEAGGWDAEYPRDRWRMHRLGFDGRRVLRFDGIAQPWLKDLAKQWVRWRLSIGLGLEAGGVRPLRALTRFARFLAEADVARLALVDRGVLERYLADLHAEMSGSQRQGDHIGLLNGFFTAIRQHRWDDTLPATATYFSTDHPRRSERLPRALAEHVMAQVEHAENLARWDNPTYLLVTVILIRCGLRISDALKLERDCVACDADGAPYLRYFNHKMKRQALVPIDEELRHLIGEQQQRILDRWPDGPPGLFPRPTKNIDGQAPTSSHTYRLALYRWLQRCDVRDEHGRAVHLTPHQWRHTLGTRMINRDVPQEVVRRILDHDSPQMTSHYARLHDTTVRRHWEQARKVNIDGERVTIDPDGPLAEAAWAKQRLGRVTQALPNGYCGLPVQKTCPHANACLTCPMFITTPEFLPQHHQHRRQVVQIISAAEARGHTRLVEMNRQVLTNLDHIIVGLETDADPSKAADAS